MHFIKKVKPIKKEDEKYFEKGGNKFIAFEESHKKPVSRRDFFSRLIGATAGFAVTPSLFNVFSSKAYAQEIACPPISTTGSSHIPCIILDYAGGLHQMENVVALDRDGGELAPGDYRQFGILDYGEAGGYTRDDRFGLPMWGAPAPEERPRRTEDELTEAINGGNDDVSRTGASGFVEGFTFEENWESRVDLNQVDSLFIAGSSNSDNSGNMLAAGPGIAMTGVTGGLGNLFGTQLRSGGGRHETPFLGAVAQRVGSAADINSLAGLASLTDYLSPAQSKAVVERIQKITTESQLKTFMRLSPQQQVDEAIKCGIIKASDLVDAFDGITLFDSTEPELLDAFTSTNTTIPIDSRLSGPNSTAAGLVQLAINGYAKCVVVQLGGHDRHRGQADVRPYEAQYLQGELTRAILQYAQAKNSPVMVIHTTDGAMSSDANAEPFLRPNGRRNAIHRGDSDAPGGQLIFLSSPKIDRTTNSHWDASQLVGGQPRSRMLGGFQSRGLDNGASFFAQTPAHQARMQVWLYCQANGISDEAAEKVIGDLRNFDQYRLLKNLIG